MHIHTHLQVSADSHSVRAQYQGNNPIKLSRHISFIEHLFAVKGGISGYRRFSEMPYVGTIACFSEHFESSFSILVLYTTSTDGKILEYD